MKKLFIIFLMFLIIGCTLNGKRNSILKRIEIDESKCKIESDIDTHGGFNGDGEYFAKVNCSKFDYDELSNHWKKLPLSDSLNEAIQMKNCTDNGCQNFDERFSISSIENGYYYFLDRHSESKNKYDDIDLNNRSSWNFTLAIIDVNTDIIYYYELDT